ncbi:MAG: hypothetical protein P1V81_02635 [Planctomycetota bacterium]|nr:hypothetical protein [Planctomycetota bacterium]
MAQDPSHPDDLERLFSGALQFELDRAAGGPHSLPRSKRRLRGAALLQGDSPRRIMQGLMDGDPLDMDGRCGRRMEHQALLMDRARVRWRSVSYLAYLAARDGYRGNPPLDQFIERAIDQALESLIEEDWEADRSDAPIDPELEQYASIALEADLDPRHARRVTLEFNLHPLRLRRPLFAVLVAGRGFAEVAEASGLATAELERELRTTLTRMLRFNNPGEGLDESLDQAMDDLLGKDS